MALRYRERTGCGQYVDAALYESVFRCTDELVPIDGMMELSENDTGRITTNSMSPRPLSDERRQMGCHRLCDGQVICAAGDVDGAPRTGFFNTYGEQKTRLENCHDVNEIVRDWCGSLTREEVLERCYATGAPAGPLNNIADIFGNRQFHARRNLVAMDEEETGETIIVPSGFPDCRNTWSDQDLGSSSRAHGRGAQRFAWHRRLSD